MKCQYCRGKGTIRAERASTGRSRLAFCDNLNCYSWFNVPGAHENAEGIVEARDGIRSNPRVTHAQRANLPEQDKFDAYAKTCPIVEEMR